MKKHPFFENYLFDENGFVFSMKNTRFLRPANHNGYCRVTLRQDGKSFRKYVHRLIAECFVDNPKGYPDVNHRNGIKHDNRAANLEWVTKKMNMQHAVKNGLAVSLKGDRNGKSKLKNDEVKLIFKMRSDGLLIKDIAAKFGLHPSHIGRILKGDRRCYQQSSLHSCQSL